MNKKTFPLDYQTTAPNSQPVNLCADGLLINETLASGKINKLTS